MREVLFRAKRIDNGEWIEGFYEIRHCALDNIKHLIFWSTSATVWEYAEIDPETLCQFTGLTDKHGNKIWENDIVKDFVNGDVYSCKWNHSNCEYELWNDKESFGLGYAALYNYQVMGTIFDNPELLKEK
jgi:uncharacterized phage protein (TIGR01671 family)